VLLPNSGNVIMTAEQAAAHARALTSIVPTRTLQGGLAAAVAFDPALGSAENAEAMEQVASRVATGAVTVASREVHVDDVAVPSGAWLGLADGEPIAGGTTFEEVARRVVEHLLVEPHDVLTLLTGAGAEPVDRLVAAVASAHPDVEVEVHEGGQPHYALLLAAE
jgi:dihydroxyacetone kinase-like predicted kinase